MDSREVFLAHHGILGQKWGRRNGPPYPLDASDHSASEKKAGWRKSLKDGKRPGDLGGADNLKNDSTKKSNGTKSSSKSSSDNKSDRPSDEEMKSYIQKRNLEKTYRRMKNEENSELSNAKKLVDQSNELVNQTKRALEKSSRKSLPKMDLSKMSDKEMRDAINRYNLEMQYQRMLEDQAQISRGRSRVNGVLDGAGVALGLGSTALGIALTIKQLKG